MAFKIPNRTMLDSEELLFIEAIRKGDLTLNEVDRYFREVIGNIGDMRTKKLLIKAQKIMLDETGKAMEIAGSSMVVFSSQQTNYVGFGTLPEIKELFHQSCAGMMAGQQPHQLFYMASRHIRFGTYHCIMCGNHPMAAPVVHAGSPAKPVKFWLDIHGGQIFDALVNKQTTGGTGPQWAPGWAHVAAVCNACNWACMSCGQFLSWPMSTNELLPVINEGACFSCAGSKLSAVAPPKVNRKELANFRRKMVLPN